MTNEDLNSALYGKMSDEQTEYKKWLLQQPPEEILNHAYEYAVREDILASVEIGDMSSEYAEALLRVQNPLAETYGVLQHMGNGYMDTIRDGIEECAWQEIQREEKRIEVMRETPVYHHSAEYARQHGETEQYHASWQANIACQKAIDRAIQDHYDGSHLDSAAIRQVVDAFGYDRMLHVLANTIRQKEWDGRFSDSNRFWARTTPVCEDSDDPEKEHSREFAVRSHSVIVDAFITMARHEYLLTQPLTLKEVIDEVKRIYAGLTETKEPNSPHGTHFMVEISPDFLQRASDKDRNNLMRLLPFKTLSITSLDGYRGMFALISKDEDRTPKAKQKKEGRNSKVKQKKTSIREKLQAEKDTPAASKQPTGRKAEKPEL